MGFFDGLLGSAVSGIASIFGGSQQNASAKQIAAENNRIAVELASTQHQREVADLKAAGLNPILSAGGSGSAVPALQQAPVVNEMAGVDSAVNSGLKSSTVRETLNNLKADTAKKESEESANLEAAKTQQENQKLLREQTKLSTFNQANVENDTQLKIVDYWLKDAQKQLTFANTHSARNAARLSDIEAKSAEDLGSMYRNIERSGSLAKGFVGGAKALKDIFAPRAPTTFNFGR